MTDEQNAAAARVAIVLDEAIKPLLNTYSIDEIIAGAVITSASLAQMRADMFALDARLTAHGL